MDTEDKAMGRDKEHNYEWRKQNIRRIVVNLNKVTQKDIIEHLDRKPNKQAYIIELIKRDIGD